MYISSLSYATSSTAINFPNFQLNRHSRKPPSPSANFFSHYSFSKRPASLNSVGCSLYRPGHFSSKKFGFKQGLKYSRMTNQCLESSNEQLDEFVKIANRVADAAGQVIRQHFRKNVDILDKEDLSPLTIADRAAEEVMRVIISEHFPTHAIFGEENGWTSKEENAEYVWVLDPIDGTKSFITGKPLFGTLTALVQNDKPICKCSVSLSRLAVLNLSGNHLTDACARYISTVVEECKSLQTLNLEDCALTSRTIQSIGHALPQDSQLEKLSIGKNSPISGNAMAGLLKKLSMLPSFQHLDITNVELNEMSIESLCHLLQSSSILSLAIGGTHIGVDGALELSRSLAKTRPTVKMLDMSFCWVDPSGGSKLFEDVILLKYLVQLDLSGNQLEEWGANVLGLLVAKAGCKLKILILNRCHLGKSGILKIMKSLSENRFLEELGLAGNNIGKKEGIALGVFNETKV